MHERGFCCHADVGGRCRVEQHLGIWQPIQCAPSWAGNRQLFHPPYRTFGKRILSESVRRIEKERGGSKRISGICGIQPWRKMEQREYTKIDGHIINKHSYKLTDSTISQSYHLFYLGKDRRFSVLRWRSCSTYQLLIKRNNEKISTVLSFQTIPHLSINITAYQRAWRVTGFAYSSDSRHGCSCLCR